MVGIFIQFQLSDQHCSVMSVEMQVHNCALASHYPAFIHQITLDAGPHHNRANNTSYCVTLDVTLHCNPMLTSWQEHTEDSHFIRAPRICPINSHLVESHHLLVDLWHEVTLFHRAHYLSRLNVRVAWYRGWGMQAFCDALYLRFLAGSSKSWTPAKTQNHPRVLPVLHDHCLYQHYHSIFGLHCRHHTLGQIINAMHASYYQWSALPSSSLHTEYPIVSNIIQ